MASTAVEARSLSTLTTLASQPPRYPRNPTHERHEPLVLYIARVPGSRDVFLTPLKPREKIVTAEDVQSCLYYLHIDQPEDAQYLEGSSEDQETESETPPPPPVPRKAVASSAFQHNSNLLAPELPPPPVQAPMHPSHVTQRKPISMSPLAPRPGADSRYSMDSSDYSGPEARDHYRGRSADLTVRHSSEQPPTLPPRRKSEHPLPLPPRPPHLGEPSMRNDTYRLSQERGSTAFKDPFSSKPTSQNSNYSEQTRASHSRVIRPPMSSEKSGTFQDLGASLTLIRRDPSSSAQWNVAKIEDPPILEVSSSSLRSRSQGGKRAGAPMYIEISNPGYSKFLNTSENLSSLVTGGNDLSAQTLKDMAANMSAKRPGSSSNNVPTETVFKRRLWMEGTRHNDKSFGHRRLNSYDSSIGSDAPRSSSNGRNNERLSAEHHNSDASYLSRDDQGSGNVQIPDKRTSSFRGYAFTSPWNGRCEFSTGGAGRSLKCKHTMSGGHQGAASSTPIAATVSELRFNLPGASIIPSTPKDDDTSSKRSSFFRPRHGRHKSFASDVGLANDIDKLDLSLGQEQAGGGFGGKQAKLGKLIVEDEGLKMIDLLVAANMALYWRVYEKVDGKSRRANTSSEGY